MNALVTGGGGFLGRHIVRLLLERGDRVRIIARSPYPDLAAQGVDCRRADIADYDAMAPAFKGIDLVFHAASLAGIWGRAALYESTNIIGTMNVLEACKAHNVSGIVYTSTPSVVYGCAAIEGGDESLPYPPSYLTHYARTKAVAERMVMEVCAPGKAVACSLRPHLIYGPGDTNLVPRLAARARAGRLVQIGDGTNLISVSRVSMVAAAHIAAAERLRDDSPVCGECYFVNDPEPVNCWEFIRRLLQELDCPPITRRMPLSVAYALGLACEVVYGILGIDRDPPMTRFLALQLATSHWFRIDKARRDFLRV